MKRTIDTKYAQINYAAIDALTASQGRSTGNKRKQSDFVPAAESTTKKEIQLSSDDVDLSYEPQTKRIAFSSATNDETE